MSVSIYPLSSASQAQSYYGDDNYYAGSPEAPEPSAWWGRGASKLGLKGQVNLETFVKILEGEVPGGQVVADPDSDAGKEKEAAQSDPSSPQVTSPRDTRKGPGLTAAPRKELPGNSIDVSSSDRFIVGQRENETAAEAAKRTHRPGFDLTFTAPKSVSLQLYLGGDQRIFEAHNRALDKTLSFAERHFAGTRIRDNSGTIHKVKTGNLVAAKFHHDISRDQDPHLHTHVVVANMTQSQDGRWRAIHNDPFFEHRSLLSLAFDAYSREEYRKLGYQVRLIDGKKGTYEISGVPEKAREEFSRGARRVNEAAAGLEGPTPKAMKELNRKTRPSKTRLTRAERAAAWEARGHDVKPTLVHLVDAALTRVRDGLTEIKLDATQPLRTGLSGLATKLRQNILRPIRTLRLDKNDPYPMNRAGSEREYAARAATSAALRHHEERQAAFSLHSVRRIALQHGADGITLTDVEKELRILRKNEQVFVNAKDPNAESTTANAIAEETRLKALVAAAGATKPVVEDIVALRSRLAQTFLNDGQKAAVMTIVADKSRLVGVQGIAGAGKTYMMGIVADEASAKGVGILALAPTNTARKLLEGSLGTREDFTAMTVHKFLLNQQRAKERPDFKDKIVLIDEASGISTRKMNETLQVLVDGDARKIVVSGDRRQHGAVEAGKPFAIMQGSGMLTAVMKQIVRLAPIQQHAAKRAAITAAAEGKVKTAVNRLRANMEVAGGAKDEQRLNELAKKGAEAWMRQFKTTGFDTLGAVAGHTLRGWMNGAIRVELMKAGELGSAETRIPILVSESLTRAEALSPRSYKPNDILLFHARVGAIHARKDQIRTVTAVNEARGLVTIADTKGRTRTVTLDRLMGRYDSAPFSLNRAEDLELRRNDMVMFRRSDNDKDVQSLSTGQVVRFDEKTVTLNMNGQHRVFDRSDPILEALSYSYFMTTHAAQGKTAPGVVVVMDSKERMLTSQVSFYVGISRTASDLNVIVDNKGEVIQQLERETGLKSSALEAKLRMNTITQLDKDASDRVSNDEASKASSGLEKPEGIGPAGVDEKQGTDVAPMKSAENEPSKPPSQDLEMGM